MCAFLCEGLLSPKLQLGLGSRSIHPISRCCRVCEEAMARERCCDPEPAVGRHHNWSEGRANGKLWFADAARTLGEDGCQHEAEEEDEEREEGAEAANGIEWRWVVDGRDTKQAHTKKHGAPDVPGLPEMKQAQGDESKRYKKRGEAMQARANGTEDMAAIQLAHGEQVHRSHEQTDPCGAADGGKEKRAGVNAGMQEGVEKSQ